MKYILMMVNNVQWQLPLDWFSRHIKFFAHDQVHEVKKGLQSTGGATPHTNKGSRKLAINTNQSKHPILPSNLCQLATRRSKKCWIRLNPFFEGSLQCRTQLAQARSTDTSDPEPMPDFHVKVAGDSRKRTLSKHPHDMTEPEPLVNCLNSRLSNAQLDT